MVLTVSLLATIPFAQVARYATLLLRRRTRGRVIKLVQTKLKVVPCSLASTGVGTHTRRLLDATALVQQQLVVVVRPQEPAKADTNVWTTKDPTAIIAREVPL